MLDVARAVSFQEYSKSLWRQIWWHHRFVFLLLRLDVGSVMPACQLIEECFLNPNFLEDNYILHNISAYINHNIKQRHPFAIFHIYLRLCLLASINIIVKNFVWYIVYSCVLKKNTSVP